MDPASTPSGLRSVGSTTTRSSSLAASRAREQLKDNRIFINSRPAPKTWSVIQEYVKAHIDCERDSPSLLAEGQDRIARQEFFAENYENNAVDALGPLLFPDMDGLEGLARIRDISFAGDCVPRVEDDDVLGQKIMEDAGYLKTPKPDLVFGYDQSAFNYQETKTNRSIPSIASISPIIFHPFFAVEWKVGQTGGSMFDAENQAACDGAAMVWARQQLHHLATGDYGHPSVSVCFSLTIDSSCAFLWVHWFDPETGYHMMNIQESLLRNAQLMRKLRAMIANVVDWGLGVRLRQVKVDLGEGARRMRDGRRERKREGMRHSLQRGRRGRGKRPKSKEPSEQSSQLRLPSERCQVNVFITLHVDAS
jgi:hypothetical protein